MFVLDQSDSFLWPVEIALPADGGKYETHKINLRFKRLPQSDIEKIGENGTDKEFAKKVVTGWSDVVDKDGNPIPFEPDAFDKLLEIAMVAALINKTYVEAMLGAAARKN